MNNSGYSILFKFGDPTSLTKNHAGNLNIQDFNYLNCTLRESSSLFPVYSICKIQWLSKKRSVITRKSEKENLVNCFKSYSAKQSILKL